jgi:hypothetical protein
MSEERRVMDDMDLWEQSYQMGRRDATEGLPEDPDPTCPLAGEHPTGADCFAVWDAYIQGWVDAGGELPF